MKLHAMLVASLMMPISICAADEGKSLFPFQLGTDTFDAEVTTWHSKMMENLALAAQKDDSDWAKWTVARTEMPLAEVCAHEKIITLAQKIYAQIQLNPEVKRVFEDAKDATAKNENLSDRQQKWTTFRRVGAQQLTVLRKEHLPTVQDPTPGSSNALNEFIERNKDLQLDEDGKNTWQAYDLVLYTFRQNHRLVDPESDGANLLLHKKVTDK